MITFIKQNKLVVLLVVAFVFAALYFAFFANSGGSNALLTSDANAPSAGSEQLLVTLANLRTIRLDGALFQDPVYLSLNDFGVTLQPQPAGRHNPFAPFVYGTVQPQNTAPTTNIQIQRLQPTGH